MSFADIEEAANYARLCSPEILTYAILSEAAHGNIENLNAHFLVSRNALDIVNHHLKLPFVGLR